MRWWRHPRSVFDAIAILDKEQVDLILCDVRLTGERTGIDLAREARGRSIPVLFVTGDAPDNASELVVGVLMKPYSHGTMRSAQGRRQLSCREEGAAAKGAYAVSQGRSLKRVFNLAMEVGNAMLQLAEHDLVDLTRRQALWHSAAAWKSSAPKVPPSSRSQLRFQ